MHKMKDSGIKWAGQIPENWTVNKIKYTLQERIEKNDPIKCRDILSLTAKQGVVPLSEKEGGGNKPKEDLSSYKLAYPNDIVMNSMNILSGAVGLSKYYGCVSPVYYMLRPFDNDFDVRYFNYIFQTKVFQRRLYGLGNGILIKESSNGTLNTIRMRIPMDKFGNLYIPVATAKEQQAIADYLDLKCAEIDSLVADIEKQIDTLEEYKKSVITEAVTKGLDPNVEMKDSGVEWIGQIPKHWDIIKLKYLVQERADSGLMGTGDTYIGLENVVGGKNEVVMTETEYLPSIQSICRKDDVLFNKLRPYLNKVIICPINGFCTGEFLIYKHFAGDKRYLRYFLSSCGFVDIVTSSTYGAKMPRANSQFINNMYVCYCNEIEQQEIANYLDIKCSEIEALVADKKQQLEILKEYKKSLIYEYVTGKKEVPIA